TRLALRMLASPAFSRLTTREIGRCAGFPSASHFARVIRIRTTRTPPRLRRAVYPGCFGTRALDGSERARKTYTRLCRAPRRETKSTARRHRSRRLNRERRGTPIERDGLSNKRHVLFVGHFRVDFTRYRRRLEFFNNRSNRQIKGNRPMGFLGYHRRFV